MIDEVAESGRGREHRKRLTRRALREAALELALERGLAAVPVETIAARAGVSTRTFFNYFDTKEDAVLLDLFLVPDATLEGLANGTGPDPWGELREVFAADIAHAVQAHGDLPQIMRLHASTPSLNGRQLAIFGAFEARLSDAIRRRVGGGDAEQVRARMMSGSCLTASRVGLASWVDAGRAGDVANDVRQAFDTLAPAFRGPAGSPGRISAAHRPR